MYGVKECDKRLPWYYRSKSDFVSAIIENMNANVTANVVTECCRLGKLNKPKSIPIPYSLSFQANGCSNCTL